MNSIGSKEIRVPVYEAITSLVSRSFGVNILLTMGEIFRIAHFLARQARIIRRPENLILLGAGGAVNLTAGHIPAVRYAAKTIFLTLSIINCSEDIFELHHSAKKIGAAFRGESYVLIKKNRFKTGDAKEQIHWQKKVYSKQVKSAFYLLREFFKRLLFLSLHLSDAYMAFRDNHVTEVFVYSKELVDKLIAGDAILLQKLKSKEDKMSKVLTHLGIKTPVNVLLKILEIPVAVQQKIPSASDLTTGIKKSAKASAHKAKAIAEHQRKALEEMGILSELEEASPYITYRVGGENDPNMHRFINEIQKGGPKSEIVV